MMRIILYLPILVIFIAYPLNLKAEEAKADEIAASLINKLIDSYGGKEEVLGIHSFHMKGTIDAFMLRDQGTYDLYFKRGRKLRVETRYKNSLEIRMLNGEKGYRKTDVLSLEAVYGPKYNAIVYHYKHLDLVHDLLQESYKARYGGRADVNGTDAEVLRLTDREGTVMDVYINPAGSHILKVTGHFSAGGKSIELSAEFSDFRKVGKSVFPFRITNYAGGQKIAQTVVDSYSINPEIADDLFGPPVFHSL